MLEQGGQTKAEALPDALSLFRAFRGQDAIALRLEYTTSTIKGPGAPLLLCKLISSYSAAEWQDNAASYDLGAEISDSAAVEMVRISQTPVHRSPPHSQSQNARFQIQEGTYIVRINDQPYGIDTQIFGYFRSFISFQILAEQCRTFDQPTPTSPGYPQPAGIRRQVTLQNRGPINESYSPQPTRIIDTVPRVTHDTPIPYFESIHRAATYGVKDLFATLPQDIDVYVTVVQTLDFLLFWPVFQNLTWRKLLCELSPRNRIRIPLGRGRQSKRKMDQRQGTQRDAAFRLIFLMIMTPFGDMRQACDEAWRLAHYVAKNQGIFELADRTMVLKAYSWRFGVSTSQQQSLRGLGFAASVLTDFRDHLLTTFPDMREACDEAWRLAHYVARNPVIFELADRTMVLKAYAWRFGVSTSQQQSLRNLGFATSMLEVQGEPEGALAWRFSVNNSISGEAAPAA
ncbi:hypothetical protein G7046_g7706 [Stylonectria norvegica]|nr:hypothetical protein G7046_g7706 [Stylonectria norvegica]